MNNKRMKKIAGVLLSCLLLVSGSLLPAYAEEETIPVDETAAADTVQEETNVIPEESDSVQSGVEEDVKDTIEGVSSLVLSFSEQPDEAGYLYENGAVSCLLDGKKLTGRFEVTTDFLKGDLDEDGAVNAADAALILTVAAEAGVSDMSAQEHLIKENDRYTTDYQTLLIADINLDGEINAADAASILIYSSEEGSGVQVLPPGCGTYYADADGILQKGQIAGDEQVYFAGDDYTLQKGVISDNGQAYFAGEDYALQKGMISDNGQAYFADEVYLLQKGWITDGEALYYAGNDYTLRKGFLNDGVSNYYAGEDYCFRKGLFTDGAQSYYADENYVIQKGIITNGEQTYFAGSDYTLRKGVITSGTQAYYAGEDYDLLKGWITDNGQTYYADENYILQKGWFTEGGRTYYTGSDYTLQKGWQTINTKKYYFDTSGVMQTGNVTIDGKTYRFNSAGVYTPVKICLDAGHYAKYNKSPVNSAYWESDFTWKMHLYLKAELESYGIEVITTRTNQETDLSLNARGYASEGCDLFLSIHSNASGIESVDGPLACCQVNGSADVLGQLLADKIAEVMQTKQKGSIWKRQGDYGDWYSVLWASAQVGTPGILLEHSYHTNKRATAWLLVDDNVRRLAKEEAKVLAAYFGVI